MLAARALAVLDGLATVGLGDITADEETELGSYDFVTALDAAGYASLRALSEDLARRQSEARAALTSGALSARDDDRRRVQESALALEESARAQVRLGGFRLNATTGRNLSLTAWGRQARSDLTVWRDRLSDIDIVAALEWLNGLRTRFQSDVRKARSELEDMDLRSLLTVARIRSEFGGSLPPGRKLSFADIDPAGRSAALILAMGNVSIIGGTAGGKVATEVLKDPRTGPALPIAAALMGAGQLGEGATPYPGLRSQVELHFGNRPDAPLLAASLADVRGIDLPSLFARVDRLRSLGAGDDPFVLLTLARSLQPEETVIQRFTWLATAIRPVGAPLDAPTTMAAAILAASSHPPEESATRHADLLARIGTTLSTPSVAAATLAAGPFSPAESMFLLGEACAAVARGRFFDTVLEIDKLGFLLFDHYLPPPFGVPGDGSRIAPLGAAAATAAGFLWIARFAAFQDLPVVVDVLAHPEHAHTVAGFG